MKIHTSIVGPFAAAAHTAASPARTVLPLTLKSDLLLTAADFRTGAKARGAISTLRRRVRDAVTHPSKLAYLGAERLEDLARCPELIVMVDDAGWLTRHLPLDLSACEPFVQWRGTLESYQDIVRSLWDELAAALRLLIPMPGVTLLAAEAFDVTPLTATSEQPPHPAMRERHELMFHDTQNPTGARWQLGPQWEACSSLYRVDAMTMGAFARWVEFASRTSSWAALTPVRDDAVISQVELAQTITLARARFGERLVLWSHPSSAEQAQEVGQTVAAVARAVTMTSVDL